MRYSPFAGLIFCLLLTIVLSGCGRKGPLRPKLALLPGAPQNAAIEQKGHSLLLAWSFPSVNQDGTPLTDLQGFRVYRMPFEPERGCPECRDDSQLQAEIDLDYLPAGRRSGDRLFFWDSALQAGSGYRYRIVPLTRAGREGTPTVVERVFHLPPAAPEGLRASSHDRLVRLAWEPAADPPGELLGYTVYRRGAAERFPVAPLNPQPVVAPEFEDYGPENERLYLYTVRTVVRIEGQIVESEPAAEVEARPRAGL